MQVNSSRRPADEPTFWSLIDVLGGSVTDESLDRLAETLRGLPPGEIVAFQDRLDTVLASLATLDVRHSDNGASALGDTRRALELSIVAAGHRSLAEVLAQGSVEADDPPDATLGLADIARVTYEDVTGSAWPEPDLWAELAKHRLVSATLVGMTRRQKSHPVVLAVESALDRWTNSGVYSRAIHAGDFGLLYCHGALYDPRIPGAVTGTWWRSRRGPGVLKVTFQIDLDSVEAADEEAAGAFVRTIIDGLARQYGLPSSTATLGTP